MAARSPSRSVSSIPNFLQVVPLPLVAGDPRTVLSHPESVVLTQSMARKYFGDADPIGKTISPLRPPCLPTAPICDNSLVPLKVTGVMRDLPHNTHLYVDMLVPNTSIVDRISRDEKQCWVCNDRTFGYVTLAPGADPATVLAKLKPVLDRSVDLSAFTTVKLPGSKILEVRLVPFQDAHLTTDQYFGMKPPGSWTTLYGMGAIGILILLVACFNFMNLATARATMRAREISLRKCVGARRGQLIAQFLGESVLISLLALMVALALVEVLLPSYASFLQAPLALHYLSDWPLMLGLVAIAVAAGLVGGLYPALVLSGFRPAAVLRANQSGNPGSGTLRTTLGGAAIRGFHRVGHRRHGCLPADRLCAASRPGLPPRQYRHHQRQPPVAPRHEGLCRCPGPRAGHRRRHAVLHPGLPGCRQWDDRAKARRSANVHAHPCRGHAGLFPALWHPDSRRTRPLRPAAARMSFPMRAI